MTKMISQMELMETLNSQIGIQVNNQIYAQVWKKWIQMDNSIWNKVWNKIGQIEQIRDSTRDIIEQEIRINL
jgi:hypothetical protein